MNKQYLGDFVSVEIGDDEILLTHEDGINPSIVIPLYPDTLNNLLAWVKELKLI